jgi:hypothetical protein
MTLVRHGGGRGRSTRSGTATSLMYPPGRVERRVCNVDSWVPTHSSTDSAPRPFVSPLIRAIPASPRSVTTSVAPSSRASFCREGVTARGARASPFRGESRCATARGATQRGSPLSSDAKCVGDGFRPTLDGEGGPCASAHPRCSRRGIRQAGRSDWPAPSVGTRAAVPFVIDPVVPTFRARHSVPDLCASSSRRQRSWPCAR